MRDYNSNVVPFDFAVHYYDRIICEGQIDIE